MKITRYFSLIKLPLLSVLLSNHVLAQDYLAENDFFGDSPEVLTVSRVHKPLANSPASVTVIDRQMIRDSGAREIADIFRMVPGFVVGYKNGNTPVVTYHGMGLQFHRQLQVLVDGRSVFNPASGGVPWSQLPLLLEDIERIEVTRGPNAVTYGASAFLATINIITRHAAEDLGGKVSVTHDLDEDNTAQDIYLRYGNNYKDFDWRISAGREEDDGYEAEFDSKILRKINIRTDFLTAYNQFWSVSAGLTESTIGRGDDAIDDPYRDEETLNSYQNIKWELQQDAAHTTVKLTHSRLDQEDAFTAIQTPVTADISFDFVADRLDLELFQNRFLSQNLTWNYGLSVRKDEVTSFWLFNNNETQHVKTNNLFSSLEWKLPSSTIVDMGFLIEDSNITRQQESFRLSIIQSIDNHHLRFVSSSAKRNPIIWEQEGNISFDATIDQNAPFPFDAYAGQTIPYEIQWLNGDNLMPESILSHEIGLLSHFMDHELTTDIKVFEYEITDQIYDIEVDHDPLLTPLPFDDDQYSQMINGDKTRVSGIELYFNYSPRHSGIRLFGGLSLVDADSFDEDIERSIPDKTGYFGGHYNFNPHHQLSAVLYWVDELSWVDSNDRLDAYNKLDLRYEYTLDPKNQVKLELIGHNLAEEYAEYKDDNIQEKSYLIRVSGRF